MESEDIFVPPEDVGPVEEPPAAVGEAEAAQAEGLVPVSISTTDCPTGRRTFHPCYLSIAEWSDPSLSVMLIETPPRSAMTSPTPSECQSVCINFLIFLDNLILFTVNKLYVECKVLN